MEMMLFGNGELQTDMNQSSGVQRVCGSGCRRYGNRKRMREREGERELKQKIPIKSIGLFETSELIYQSEWLQKHTYRHHWLQSIE